MIKQRGIIIQISNFRNYLPSGLEVKMDADAEAYEELSQPQTETGSKYVSELNIPGGAKVLDMGCGTGHVTKYVADIVGSVGVVVGIDPDAERIKIAQEKYKDISHLQFHVGDSVTGFPHDDEPYYDFHVSTHAFHWFPPDHKKLYIQKAYQSLKPGGKLAILCSDRTCTDPNDQFEDFAFYSLPEDEMGKLFQDVGLFTNVVIKPRNDAYHFKTYQIFKRWLKATTHHDIDDVDVDFVNAILDMVPTFHDDGSVSTDVNYNTIIACKE